MSFKRTQQSCIIALVVAFGALLIVPAARSQDGNGAVQQVASTSQLKAKAFEALLAGKFDLTNDYLSQAAAISKDPSFERMADWTRQFEQQRKVFADERRKEFDKAVGEVKLLLSHKKDAVALEHAARAHLLAEDKGAFRKEPWVVQLLADARRLAETFDKEEQWLKSLRLYSQLSAIEPEVPAWKERLKTSTRRLRLLAMYTPDELKRIQETDIKERQEVEAILQPTTQPTTKPAEEENENPNRVSWKETLRDVRMDMLRDALLNAHQNYYKTVTYRQMMLGGLNGLRVVLTTPALEKAFEGLSRPGPRNDFLGMIDGSVARLERTISDTSSTLVTLLSELQKVNEATVRLPEEVLVSEFADGAFAALDPFSGIIWPNDWEEFQKTTKGEFSGVGIQIQIDEAGNLKVVSPLEDSPAYRAGIKPEWIVSHINGKTAKWISLNQAVKLITGPPGTEVTLTIRDTNGDSKEYRLVRETIKVASVKGWLHRPGGGWDYLIDPDQKIGYIRITNFTKTTTDDLKATVSELGKSGIRGVILDLRYNPGGLLNSATDVVDRFIEKGRIVTTRADRTGASTGENVTTASRDNDEVTMPVIVLVNQYSASASEIVSGALQDHKRALIVGERTFGKGSVQMLYPLGERQPPLAVLKLTTSHYYLPLGKCIHREESSRQWGVEPDLSIEMTPEQMRAAIDARQEYDILRDAAPAEVVNLPEKTDKVEDAVAATRKKDPLACDPQLGAALLVMRLQLAGAAI